MESSRKKNSAVRERLAASTRRLFFYTKAALRGFIPLLFERAFVSLMPRYLSRLLLLGVVPTAAFVAVMSWFCCFEFYRMMRLDGKVPNEILGLTAAVFVPVCAWRVGVAYRYAFHPYLVRGYVVPLFAPHAYRRCCGYHIRSFVYRLHALCHRVDARVYPWPCRRVAIHRYLRFSLGQ